MALITTRVKQKNGKLARNSTRSIVQGPVHTCIWLWPTALQAVLKPLEIIYDQIGLKTSCSAVGRSRTQVCKQVSRLQFVCVLKVNHLTANHDHQSLESPKSLARVSVSKPFCGLYKKRQHTTIASTPLGYFVICYKFSPKDSVSHKKRHFEISKCGYGRQGLVQISALAYRNLQKLFMEEWRVFYSTIHFNDNEKTRKFICYNQLSLYLD